MPALVLSEKLWDMDSSVQVDYQVHELIAERHSHRRFSGKPVSDRVLRSLFEAARWAASSYNEQPWRFIVVKPDQSDHFEAMLACLTNSNRDWAQHAGALVLSLVATHFARNQKHNAHAWHDVGLAVGQLTFQATALGLGVRQMAGFYEERVRTTYQTPAGIEPVSVIAIGYPELGDSDAAGHATTRSSRHPQSEFVFHASWGSPL